MKRIFNVLYGGITVPDGKIDTNAFGYNRDTDRYSGMHICRERVDYQPDDTWKELYQGIHTILDERWFNLISEHMSMDRNDTTKWALFNNCDYEDMTYEED